MDPLANMFQIIKNAQKINKETVSIPFSKLKLAVAFILKREGFINDVKQKKEENQEKIIIKLKYKGKEGVISEIKRISKPGRRVYLKNSQLRPVLRGFGIAIISTPLGLLTNKEAKKKGVGGEIICEVW